jgi:UPF0755 protein
MRRIFLSLAGIGLLALVGILGVAGYGLFQSYLTEPGPAAEASVVALPRGAGLGAIVNRLDQAGVIDHPWLFQLAVRVKGQDRALQAGEYAFPAHVSPTEVIDMLARGEVLKRRLTVVEGQTVAEVFAALHAAEGLEGDLPPLPAEGSLLPETYVYSRGDQRGHLVTRMQTAMAEVLDEAWAGRDQDLPFAAKEEALIMASIVDKETGVPAEREQVAAVFVNRLREGMRLQSDPTIIYGLTGGQGPLDRALTRQDWEFDHPYNTYRIKGLPPGPIGNPGRESIAAVMHPAAVDYLYFVADGSGGHAFARTLAEHNRNVAQWRKIKAGTTPRPIMPSPARPEIEADGSALGQATTIAAE